MKFGKYIFSGLMILFATFSMQAQIFEPVDWAFESKDNGDGTFDLVMTASLDKGWYIYSQDLDDGGPIPTAFEFEEGNLVGEVREEGDLIEKYDELFAMNLRKYSNEVSFVATVKGSAGDDVSGYLTFMTCDDERCLPPEDVDFEFTLGK